ncbi:MAG: hypothetical protein GC206_14935 [Alphaproteobacteria bacterium]|nr:hypothetical protein [Alphaproteobacteria bacterium]
MHSITRLAAAAFLVAIAPSAAAQSGLTRPPDYEAPPVVTLQAALVREFDAPEARQGVAVDDRHFYAIVNTMIGKYDKETGARIAGWSGPRGGLVRHINSCFAEPGRLYCANSNFPRTPMASSVEIFDTATMTHIESHSLGLQDEGSLTFFGRFGDGWFAGFAQYDGEGGLEYKDSRFAGIVLYDAQWRRTGGYALPDMVLARMAPHAASGGAIGPDGLLYLFGHDRPELYVLARPTMGPTLVHVATIAVDAAGQAFAWDRAAMRTLYAINRPTGAVRVFEIPEVSLDHSPDARRFETTPRDD